MGIDYRLLGRLEVVRDGVSVELGALPAAGAARAAAGQRRDGAVDRPHPRRAVGRGGRDRQAELVVGVRVRPARRVGARSGEALRGHDPADPRAGLRAGGRPRPTPMSDGSSGPSPRRGSWPRPIRQAASGAARRAGHVARACLRGVRLRGVGADRDRPARGAPPGGDREPDRRRPAARAVPRARLRAAEPGPPAPAPRAASSPR